MPTFVDQRYIKNCFAHIVFLIFYYNSFTAIAIFSILILSLRKYRTIVPHAGIHVNIRGSRNQTSTMYSWVSYTNNQTITAQ